MIPHKLQDPFTDTDSSIELSTSSYSTNYFSSSDWKINSESDFSSSTKKKYSTRKTLNLKCTNHDTIKKQYFAQIQDRINKTKNNKASGTKKSLRTNNGPTMKNVFQTIHQVDGQTQNSNDIQKSLYHSDSTPTDDPTYNFFLAFIYIYMDPSSVYALTIVT